MALTNKQMEGVLNLFVTSFMNETEENERKKLYFNFEDAFGKGIPYWKKLCRKLMQNKNVNDRVLEYYDEIVNRGETSYEEVVFTIRMFQKKDLLQVRELINKNFKMGLTSFDDERFVKFIDSGYSVVACNDEEIFGVALAYEVPDYNIETICLDTFIVAEPMRGYGIGKNMFKHIKGLAKANSGAKKMKLQTDRKIEAYSIYKHWGFEEDDLVHMLRNAKDIETNYILMSQPYIGVFADGAEQWCRKVGLQAPQFNDTEKEYYTILRGRHKLYELSYEEYTCLLMEKFYESEKYFFQLEDFVKKFWAIIMLG